MTKSEWIGKSIKKIVLTLLYTRQMAYFIYLMLWYLHLNVLSSSVNSNELKINIAKRIVSFITTIIVTECNTGRA